MRPLAELTSLSALNLPCGQPSSSVSRPRPCPARSSCRRCRATDRLAEGADRTLLPLREDGSIALPLRSRRAVETPSDSLRALPEGSDLLALRIVFSLLGGDQAVTKLLEVGDLLIDVFDGGVLRHPR